MTLIFHYVSYYYGHTVCILHRESDINLQWGPYGGLAGALLATLWATQCLFGRHWGFIAASAVLCWLYFDDMGPYKPAMEPMRGPLRCFAGYTLMNTMPFLAATGALLRPRRCFTGYTLTTRGRINPQWGLCGCLSGALLAIL